MTRPYTIWGKEVLQEIAASSISYAECLRKMGLREAGGNYKNLQKNLSKFDIDISHMLHEAHNSGKEFIPFEGLKKTSSIKNRLLKKFGHSCQSCGLSDWMGSPIPLELEHIDGNNRNHAKDNLKLLCCNCHAQTPTWRNKKRQ